MEGFGNVKGYKKIIQDYLNKIVLNNEKNTLKHGIIISFSGFSPKVRKQTVIDNIKLISPQEIEDVFRKQDRSDLLEKLYELRGVSSSICNGINSSSSVA